jgi:TonB family protein
MPYSAEPLTASRAASDQHFRAAMISSAAIHAVLTLALLFGPLLWPRPPIMPNIVPVNVVQPPAAGPETAPPPAEEAAPEEPEVETEEESQPEPEPIVTEPEPIPRSLEDLRREQEAEAEQRRLEEEERQRREREEADRRRREEEERRRREEEERRRQPQKAARRSSQPAQEQSAARTGIDLTGAQDDSQGFTVEEFPFADYLLRIRDLISARWNPPPLGPYSPKRRAEVLFRIGRDGKLVVQPRMLSASGESLFDRAALQAIAQAAPFPPLPRQYQGQSLGVGLAFVQE